MVSSRQPRNAASDGGIVSPNPNVVMGLMSRESFKVRFLVSRDSGLRSWIGSELENVGNGSKGDLAERLDKVCFTPNNGHPRAVAPCGLVPISDIERPAGVPQSGANRFGNPARESVTHLTGLG